MKNGSIHGPLFYRGLLLYIICRLGIFMILREVNEVRQLVVVPMPARSSGPSGQP